MAEKSKTEKDNDKNKILAVIGILIISGGVLFFLANSKSNDNGIENGNLDTEVSIDEEASLTSQEWTWVNTQLNDDSESVPSTPGEFTVTFTEEDNKLFATTDCNNGNSTYEVEEGNTLTIGLMAATLQFCENSNEQAFFSQLQEVQSYLIENGKLILLLQFDSGSMTFE